MNRKSITIFGLTTLGLLLVASLAFARGPYGGGYGGCPGWGGGPAGPGSQAQQLSPEQQQKYEAIMDEHYQATSQLRERMWAQQNELQALANNPNADPKRVRELSESTARLRTQMQQSRMQLNDKLQAEFGDSFAGYGPGNRRGMRGGRGFGGRGGCPGGNCW